MFDLTVAVQIVLAVWIVNYKIPQEGIKAVTLPEMGAGRNPDQGIALVEQENRSDTQPDQQADAQPEQQAGIQPEQQTDAQPEQQTDAQSEQQSGNYAGVDKKAPKKEAVSEKKKCEWRTKSAGTEKRKAEGERKYSRIEREKSR